MKAHEIISQIEKLEKAIASPATPENFKKTMHEKVDDLNKKLDEFSKVPVSEKKEKKSADKKQKKQPKSSSSSILPIGKVLVVNLPGFPKKNKIKLIEIDERDPQNILYIFESVKNKNKRITLTTDVVTSIVDGTSEYSITKKQGNKKPSSKKTYTAKRDGDAEEPGCDELLKRYNERREAAKKSQHKAKTTPVFRKITADVVDAVEKAIKNVSAEDIEGAPKTTIVQFENLKNAAQNFLKAFKDVLGSDYKSKESEKEIKELEDLIAKLEDKYLKK